MENFHGNDDDDGDYHVDNSSGGGMAIAMAKAMEMAMKMVPSLGVMKWLTLHSQPPNARLHSRIVS